MPKLRELQMKDASKMYEWISDSDVIGLLLISRHSNSIEKVYEFIRKSWTDRTNIHFAIVTDDDDYVGTVSLKNVNHIDRNAEYAIAIHKDYWGKEFAKFATDSIIEYGFGRLNLHKIYLKVSSSNVRANMFYEKYGFAKEGIFKQHMIINGEFVDLNWFCIFS